ncbi:MAG: rod-binding protein [Halanaerobiaceae bacterium]
MLNNNLINRAYDDVLSNSKIKKMEKELEKSKSKQEMSQKVTAASSDDTKGLENEQLKVLANEFTSILMNQMFKSMRNTISDDHLFHGGYSEEVFTDMLDEEISKTSAEQKGFNAIGRLLYEQLSKKL